MAKLQAPEFTTGQVTWITKLDDLPWDDPGNPKMDFGILRLDEGQSITLDQPLEKAILLMTGTVKMASTAAGIEDTTTTVLSRDSIFDDNPCCLHVPATSTVEISAGEGPVELAIIMTPNDVSFPVTVYLPGDCRSEQRGEGTMRETSTRVVRTIFDYDNEPESNLVLGEVITYPGKWSSYPPHHHPQPEVYHYRFLSDAGFGFAGLGDDVVKVQNGDTVTIFNVTHPQTAAPGYAMWYLWAIRHLDGLPYSAPSFPIFEPEHAWVMDKDSDDKIWPFP
jgi:5-deoxy-glucuronate isomerase